LGGCHGVFALASSPMLSPTLAMGSEMGWVFAGKCFSLFVMLLIVLKFDSMG